MDSDVLEKYFTAGKILAEALKKARPLILPNVKLLDITKFIEEDMIRNKGFSLAFPLNIGINEITAHYSCPFNDPAVIPSEGLVKLDAGVQIDGFTTDMAISIQVGTEKYQVLLDAAEAGLEAAIKMIKAGVKVGEVGTAVEKAIQSYGVKPISNLSGHLMTQYQLHAGVSVPSVGIQDPNNAYRFKNGDIFALEPFTTVSTAAGIVRDRTDAYIYALLKRKVRNLPPNILRLINRIWGERRSLPFSFRWYEAIPDTLINRLQSEKIIHKFPVLVEASKQVVAQAEKTILVQNDGCEIITKTG
jgi:methionyl aminopeptidase